MSGTGMAYPYAMPSTQIAYAGTVLSYTLGRYYGERCTRQPEATRLGRVLSPTAILLPISTSDIPYCYQLVRVSYPHLPPLPPAGINSCYLLPLSPTSISYRYLLPLSPTAVSYCYALPPRVSPYARAVRCPRMVLPGLAGDRYARGESSGRPSVPSLGTLLGGLGLLRLCSTAVCDAATSLWHMRYYDRLCCYIAMAYAVLRSAMMLRYGICGTKIGYAATSESGLRQCVCASR
eukprot:1257517-Rhodomonas_salina.1